MKEATSICNALGKQLPTIRWENESKIFIVATLQYKSNELWSSTPYHDGDVGWRRMLVAGPKWVLSTHLKKLLYGVAFFE